VSVINVCGVLIHTLPEHSASVKLELETEPGVEVHSVTDDGRLIVTIEKDTQEETGHTLNHFSGMENVITASFIYQYFDQDDTVVEEEISKCN